MLQIGPAHTAEERCPSRMPIFLSLIATLNEGFFSSSSSRKTDVKLPLQGAGVERYLTRNVLVPGYMD